jgi:transglutaminase-like putative cysteine protease
MPHFHVVHHSTYRHASPVGSAWQVLRLRPRDEPGQRCVEFALEVQPQPGEIEVRRDFFGNAVHAFNLRTSHAVLDMRAVSRVQRDPRPVPASGDGPSLADAVRQTARDVCVPPPGTDPMLAQFLHPSPLVPEIAATRDLADGLGAPDMPVLDWIAALGACFRERFAFDPTATVVSTPLAEVIAQGRGVCQDFAHAFIGCVRQAGLAAGYVSGFLETEPPAGQLRLAGADAMHAWASIHLPGTGWVDYDPTNDCFAGTGHIVVARGRDYGDVSPVRGLFRGGGVHTLYLGVTVQPEAGEEAEAPIQPASAGDTLA